MLILKEYEAEQNYRTFMADENLFHRALDFVQRGEERFHVETESGERFDLLNVSNVKWTFESEKFPSNPLFHQKPFYPEYTIYDEHDSTKIALDAFEGYDKVLFQVVNEYTVVIARILIKMTDIKIEFSDERVRFFPDLLPHLTREGGTKTLTVTEELSTAPFIGDFSVMDSVGLFHNVFIYQWLTPLPMEQVRYLEIMVEKSEGIGSLLMVYGRSKIVFERLGWEIVLKRGSSRYPQRFLEKYFNLRETPEDSDETNTICVTNYYSLLFTKMVRGCQEPDISEETFREKFLADMTEYSESVFAGKKILGILMRGSDYISTGMSGTSAPVSPEDMFDKIHEWMDTDHFDKIFLATEDQDMLDKMCREFPGKILCVSQERYRLEQFEEGMTISQIDRMRHPSDEEYEAYIEDLTINYFYAIFLLSRCESFMNSCHCGGSNLATSLNRHRFRRMYCFADGKEEINPNTAG